MASGRSSALYRKLIAARIRSDWQYRTSFFMLLISQTMVVTLEFIAILFVLSLVPDLGGWSTIEVTFLYALATVPFAISDVLVSSVERTSLHVQTGTFDRLLLRPMPALMQIWTQEFELRRIGKLVAPLAIGVWAVANVEIEWTTARIAILILALVCATLIYSALWIATASFSFWAVASKEAMNAVTYGGQSANEYPLHLYKNWIRATLGWGIPLAFVSYVPTQWLLDATNPLGMPSYLVYFVPLVTAALLVFAMACWTVGIRHYQSTGS